MENVRTCLDILRTLFYLCSMTSLPLLPPPNYDTAPGWDGEALSRLKRMEEMGMEWAEDLLAGSKQAADAADKARLASAFSVVSRALRLTMTLRARIQAGVPDTPWRGAVEHPLNLNFDPDEDDPHALTHRGLVQRAAAEVRLAFEHVITGDDIEDGDQQDLRETLERLIERERDCESFRRGPDHFLLQRFCKELGLPFGWTILSDIKGDAQAIIVAHPDDDAIADGLTWPGKGPFYKDFIQPFGWTPPPPNRPEPPS